MKKRLWSLLLVFIMVLTMIPTTVYEASGNKELMFRWPGMWSPGNVPFEQDEDGNFPGFSDELNCVPGNTMKVFFRIVENGDTVYAPVSGDQLRSSNESVVKVYQDDMNPSATCVEGVGFGQATLSCTINGETYSMDVSVILPNVGMYSTPTSSESTYLSSFTVTDTADEFYFVPSRYYTLTNVELDGALDEIADITYNPGDNYATIKVTGTPSNYDNYTIRVSATHIYGDYNIVDEYFNVNLVNGKTTLAWTWPDYDSNNNPVMPNQPYWETSINIWPGRDDKLFFTLLKGGVAGSTITNIRTSDPSVVNVYTEQGSDVVRVEAVSGGTAELIYSDGINTYRIPVSVTLPDVGFYSSNQASEATLLKGGFEVTDSNRTFYFISTVGNFNYVNLSQSFADIATVSVRGNVATITVTGQPTEWNYMVNYQVAGWDPTDQWVSVFTPNQGGQDGPDGPDGPMVVDGLNLCFAQGGMNGMTKPQTPNWMSRMTTTAKNNLFTYFSILVDGRETEAVTGKITSSNENILTIEEVKGVNESYYHIITLDTGDVTLTWRDGNNNEYSMQVSVIIPDEAFYTTNTVSLSSLISTGYTVTESNNTIYFISRIADFVSLRLSPEFDAIADVTVNGKIATIKITGEPNPMMMYQVYYQVVGRPESSYGISLLPENSGNQGGDDGDMPPLPAGNSLLFHYTDDVRSNWGDSVYTAPGGQSEGWFIFHSEDGEPSVLSLEDLRVTNGNVVKLSSVGTPDAPDKIKFETLDWGVSQVVFDHPNGESYAFDVIADIDYINVGFYSENKIDEDTYIPRLYEVTNANKEIYLLVQNVGISDVEFYYGSDDFAKIDKISSTVYKITIKDEINNYVKYGEEIELNVSYVVNGQQKIHDGITLVNKTCKHLTVSLQGKVDASCVSKGYTGDEYCDLCKELVKKGSIIAETSHSYVGNECKVCGDKIVVEQIVDKVDTSKPVEEVTTVIEQSAVETTTKDVTSIVDAIIEGKVTEEIKSAVSEEGLKAIQKELEAGNQIASEIVCQLIDEKDIDKEVLEEVKTELGNTGKIAQFIDLSVLIKSVASDGTEKDLCTLNVLSEKVKFTIVIPEDLVKDGREFYIIRVHDGEAEKLELTKNSDGTYSFETDRFSSYALAYDEAVVNAPVTAPVTGDETNVMGYVALLVLGFAIYVFAKKNRFATK